MPSESTEQHPAAARATLVVSCAATLLAIINFTAPVSTVSAIAANLDSGVAGQVWILGSISVGLAASLLVIGSVADDYGRKRIFLIGCAVFVLASVPCAVAPDTTVFALGRVLQGIASAAILTTSLGMLGHAFPSGPARMRATGLWAAMVGGGIAVGPVYSALLIRVSDWRVAYWVIALAWAAVMVWGALTLTDSRNYQRRRLDIAGAVTLGGGISFLVAALTESRDGWDRPQVVGFLVAAIVLLVAFPLLERRVAEPMLDLALLKYRAFIASTLGAFVTGVSVIGFMTFVPLEAQQVLGLSPLIGAGILAIWSGLSWLAAPQARRLSGLLDGRYQVAVGLAVCGVGELALIGIGEHSSWWRFVPGLAIAGLGSGLANAALTGLAIQSVPADRVAMGSGANNTARYVGSAVGIAAMATIISLASSRGDAASQFGVGMSYSAVVAAVLSFVGAFLVSLCRDPQPVHV